MNVQETVFRVVMVFAVLAFVLLLVVLQLATDPMLAVVLTAVFSGFCAVALEWLEPAQEFEVKLP